MSFVHIKKIQKEAPEGGLREYYAVPSVAITTPQGRKLIPNPSGNEAILFTTLEEAESAIRRAGFDYEFEGRKTYTLSQQKSAEPSANGLNPLDQAVPILIQHLNDKESTVVAHSALALGALRAFPALDALIGILGHDDANVRKHTAEALSRLGVNAIPAMQAAFGEALASNKKNAPYIRLTIMTSLLEMVMSGAGIPTIEMVLPMAVQALNDESWLVRSQAALVVANAATAIETEWAKAESKRKKY